jgi:tetratricopeptide (TPR) repeat protein
MKKNEIREIVSLPAELAAKITEQQQIALKYLPNDIHKAVISIHAAWKLLPAPKFNTSSSHALLRDCIYILNFALKYDDAKQLLERWIKDLEASGYKIDDPLPYLLMGETLLFLEEPAGTYFQKAFEMGGEKAFENLPALYLDIASGKIQDNELIKVAFEKEDLLEVWFGREEINSAKHSVSDDMLIQIDKICEEGSELFDEDEYMKAIKVWEQAFRLIPEPKNNFKQSLWLHSSIGDAFFLLNDFQQSAVHFFAAKSNNAENGYANPFIMLRLGQSYFELNDMVKAKEYLLKAYSLGGKELFGNEDKKYLEFVRKYMK